MQAFKRLRQGIPRQLHGVCRPPSSDTSQTGAVAPIQSRVSWRLWEPRQEVGSAFNATFEARDVIRVFRRVVVCFKQIVQCTETLLELGLCVGAFDAQFCGLVQRRLAGEERAACMASIGGEDSAHHAKLNAA